MASESIDTDWRLIALLYAAGLLASAQFAKISLTLAPLSEVYPGTSVALLVSGVSVAGMVFGATAGVAVGRFGPRRVLLVSLMAAGGLTMLQSFLFVYPVLLALRVLEGFAHLGVVVAAPTLMAASARGHDVALAMGLWGTFFGVGFALSAAVIPWIGGLEAVLRAHAAALFVVAVALWPLLPRGTGSVLGAGGFVERHLRIYGTPRIVAPSLGFFAHTIVFLGLLTFLPRLVGEWTAPVLPLVALVGTFSAGLLVRFASPSSIMQVGFVGSILTFALALPFADSPPVLIVFAMIMMVGLVPGAAFADVPHLNETTQDQAIANGAIAQLGNVGTACSTPLFGFAAATGFGGLAVVAMLISTAGALAVWFIHKKIASSP